MDAPDDLLDDPDLDVPNIDPPADAVLEGVLTFSPNDLTIVMSTERVIATETSITTAAGTLELEPAEKSLDELEAEQDRIDHEVDFKFARDTLKDTVKRGSEVLLTSQALAQAADEPKAVEAFAKMLSELTKATESLLGLHQKKQEFKAVMTPITDDSDDEPIQQPMITANTVVFTGSSRDLLDLVNTKRR